MQKPDLEEAINTASKVFGYEIPITEIAEIMKTDPNLIHTEIKKNILNGSIQGRINSKSTSDRFDDILILEDISKTAPTSTEHKDPCWEKLRKNTLDGINCYKGKLNQNTSDPEIYYGLALGYLIQQNVVEANEILEECISQHLGLKCATLKISMTAEKENYSESLALTNKALELYPEDKNLWTALLVNLIQLKRIDDALTLSKKALDIFPDEKSFLRIRLIILYYAGKYDELLRFDIKDHKDKNTQKIYILSKLNCSITRQEFIEIIILIYNQQYLMKMLVLNLFMPAFGLYLYYSIKADFNMTHEMIRVLETFYSWFNKREEEISHSSAIEFKIALTSVKRFMANLYLEEEKNLQKDLWYEYNTQKIGSIVQNDYSKIKQIRNVKLDRLGELLNSSDYSNIMKENFLFAGIRHATSFPIDFLKGMIFLLQDDLNNAEALFSKAFDNKNNLTIEISHIFEALKPSVSIQTTAEIIREQKIRFKRRKRLDELLRIYHELSLEKMVQLMDFKDTIELEKFLIELPEEVPVKILGNKVRLGKHDFTSSMIEKMDKALEGWERSGFGAYSSTVFSCQIDGGTHPLKEAHYQCVSCHRFVCNMCYTSLKEVGRIICPYCESSLRFMAPLE